jgi:DNA-binding protein HU-beta
MGNNGIKGDGKKPPRLMPGVMQVSNLFFTHKGMTEMAKRIQKKDVVKRLASRLSVEEKLSEEYLDGVLETLYEAFKEGEGVTLPNFGSFYLDRRRSGCVFKFNSSQKLKALFGWSSTYKGEL